MRSQAAGTSRRPGAHAKRIDKEVDQRAHLGREVFAGGVDRVDAELDRAVLRQDLHQRARGQVRTHQERRLQHDALVLHGRGAAGVTAVGAHVRLHLHADRALRTLELPLVAGSQQRVAEHRVQRQVRRMFGHAAPPQILGRGTQDQPRRGELAADQCRGLQAGDAYREVVTLVDEVHQPVGQRDVERHLRVQRHEGRPQRRQVQQAEAHRHVDAQLPDRLARMRAEFGFGLLDALQQLPAALVEHLALGCQRELARRPVQQPGAEPALQVADQPRHRRLRQVQRVGGAHETAGVDHGDEGAHLLELVHVSIVPKFGPVFPF